MAEVTKAGKSGYDLDSIRGALAAMGFGAVPHLEMSLLAHMEVTHGILVRMECPPSVCLAGMCHGVYGTQALHGGDPRSLTDARRGEMRRLIGEEAEQLVYNFSVMSYESFGMSLRSVLRSGEPLLIDWRSGAGLRVSRDEFVWLLWLKLADVIAHGREGTQGATASGLAEYSAMWEMVAEFLGVNAWSEWTAGAATREMVATLRASESRTGEDAS